MKLSDSVRNLLDDRRLASGLAAGASGSRRMVARHGFTLSRTAALLQWRARDGLHWAVHLARAANVLSDRSAAIVRRVEVGRERGVEIEVVHPGRTLEGIELGDVLMRGLAPDRGVASDADDADRVDRWREAIGRAINRALASDPRLVEVLTPSGGRRYERRDAAGEGVDPYALRAVGPSEGRESFVFRVVDRNDLGARVRAWFTDDPVDTIHEAWRRSIVGADEAEATEAAPFSLTAVPPGAPVRLGGVARFGHAAAMRGPWLIRDGVRLVDLRATLVAAGMAAPPAGWVDCADLELRADDRGVVRNTAFERLLAWLFDMQAHTFAGEGPEPSVIWPTDVPNVRTASGRVEGVDVLRHRAARLGEVVHVSPHAIERVDARARALVYAVWPSELAVLRERMQDVRFVPYGAIASDRGEDLARLDLTPLRQGCLPPVDLGEASVVLGPKDPLAGSERRIRARVEVFVHRYPGAKLGSVVVTGFDRPLVRTRDHARVVVGVTAIVRVLATDGAEIAAIREDTAALGALVSLGKTRVDERPGPLLEAVLEGASSPLENPYLQEMLARLDARGIRLRYQVDDHGLRLAWDDHPLLALVVGHAARTDGARGEALTVRATLERLRDVGFVVLGDARRRYPALESDDPDLRTVFLRPDAVAWVGGVLDRECIDRMPTAPEAYPRVRPAAEQHALLNERATREDMAAASTSAAARVRLLGRALIHRAAGQPKPALEALRFVHRYDPRALRPSQYVSLASVLEERPAPGVVPPGAVARDLDGPVVAVPPPLAFLLHEVAGLVPGRVAPSGTGPRGANVAEPASRRPAPRRRQGASVEPLMVKTVDHELAIGSLRIAGDGSSGGVTIWSRGLRVGAVDLPEPLGRVSGRLWLTARGRMARADRLGKAVRELARAMLLDAPRLRSLLPATDRRRDALGSLVEYVARVIERDGDRHELGRMAGPGEEPSFEMALDASLRRAPVQPARTLDSLVRSCLGRRVPIERAILSWVPGRLTDRRAIEIGNRHAWVRRADSGRAASLRATVAVLDGVLRDPAWGEPSAETPAELRERWGWIDRTMWRWMAHVASG